jgi:DNA-directed RNA polymerase subunit beta
MEIKRVKKDFDDQFRILEGAIFARLRTQIVGKVANGGPGGVKKGTALSDEMLDGLKKDEWFSIRMKDDDAADAIERAQKQIEAHKKEFEKKFADKRAKITAGDDLAPGVLKMVKVYLAVKRRMQPGDKMAGRHGNKGVISMIQPVEDMPFAADGRPVDIVLNPLGVPSRMNIGQILETHLGWAAKGLGEKIQRMLDEQRNVAEVRKFLDQIYNHDKAERNKQREDLKQLNDAEILALASNLTKGVPMATPVFDGAREDEIKAMLKLADLPNRARPRCSTVAPARPSIARSRSATCTCSSSTTWSTTRCTRVRPVRTRSSPSSRWAARRSSAASASARWKSGRWKLTARPTPCRKC